MNLAKVVDSCLDRVKGAPGTMDLHTSVPAGPTVGPLSLAFGLATFRAGGFPRGLAALTALPPPTAVFVPIQVQRRTAIPMGRAPWSEPRPT